MTLQQARQEFAARLYKWSLSQARRELVEDYPLVRSVKGAMSARFLNALERFGPGEREALAVALVKRSDRDAAAVANEPMTPHEERLCDRFLEALRVPSRFERHENEKRMARALGLMKREPTDRRANRRRLGSLVRDRLEPVCGSGPERWPRHAWRYTTLVHGWQVHTYVELGGRMSFMSYGHTIGITEKEPLARSDISLFGWLGVTSMTSWDHLTVADEEEAADSLANLCSRFMEAGPELLSDLLVPGTQD